MKIFGWMLIALVSIASIGSSAFADGFRCQGLTFGTKIEVYNQLKPSQGTRNVNIMIVSDPVLAKGERTIATFSQDQNLIIQKGATYIATVDSRFKTVKDGDRKIADTMLSELSTIQLTVNFNYTTDTPSKNGEKYSALITYTHENGATSSENASCIRYKKN